MSLNIMFPCQYEGKNSAYGRRWISWLMWIVTPLRWNVSDIFNFSWRLWRRKNSKRGFIKIHWGILNNGIFMAAQKWFFCGGPKHSFVLVKTKQKIIWRRSTFFLLGVGSISFSLASLNSFFWREWKKKGGLVQKKNLGRNKQKKIVGLFQKKYWGGGGRTNERPGTDHVTLGQMRCLKTANDGADTQTSRRTGQLYDWMGPVGPIHWKKTQFFF